VTAQQALWRACWLAASLFSIPGSAQAPSEVGLSLRDCQTGATEPSPQLLELLRLELRADAVDRLSVVVRRVPGAPEPRAGGETRRAIRSSSRAELEPVLSIERGCDRVDDGLLRLGYRDPARDARLQRSLSLEDVPIALRERTLALALAELFRAGQADASDAGSKEALPSAAEAGTRRNSIDAAEIEQHPAADSGSDSERPPVELERPPAADGGGTDPAPSGASAHGRPRSSSWALAVGPALHVLPSSGTMLVGAEIALSWRSVSAGVLGSLSGNTDPLGSVAYRRLHGFVAYEVFRVDPAPFRIAAGVRAAFGATFANVTPLATALPQNVTAATGDLALETSFAWLVGSGWQTKLRLDVGYALGPAIRADDRDLANFSGLFIGAAVCLVAAL
jgi:hypothetical protein